VAAAENGYEYEVVFSSGLVTATTSAATLTVDFISTITTQPYNQTVTAGTKVTFTAAATSNPAPGVQWEVSTNGGSTFANISGATSASYSLTRGAISLFQDFWGKMALCRDRTRMTPHLVWLKMGPFPQNWGVVQTHSDGKGLPYAALYSPRSHRRNRKTA
jgi:hypothetical protein